MMLLSIFLVPLVASLIVLVFPRRANWISSSALVLSFLLTVLAYARGESGSTLEDFWLLQFKSDWLYFGLDGLSFVLLLSAEIMAAFALTTVVDKAKEQVFLLMTFAGLVGLLLAVDMLAFFVFWELMLLPVYFWVLAAGREGKTFPALQFIIFTQASGLLLLASVIAIFVFSGTTDPNQMSLEHIGPGAQLWIVMGLAAAFLVKFPIFPFHTWMPALFAEAPLGAIISGLLLKTGAYGFLRFVLPLFPAASRQLAPFMMVLGGITVVYASVLAFSQKRNRKVLAYSMIAHAGLMLMGIFSQNPLALSGAVLLVVTQSLSMAGLFLSLEAHLGFTLFFVMASLGLPGLGNFVGEWLVLFGLFQENPWMAVIGSLSLILGAAYMIRLVIRIYYGRSESLVLNMTRPQLGLCFVTAALLIWIGLSPAALLDLTVPSWGDDWSEPALPEEEGV